MCRRNPEWILPTPVVRIGDGRRERWELICCRVILVLRVRGGERIGSGWFDLIRWVIRRLVRMVRGRRCRSRRGAARVGIRGIGRSRVFRAT